MVPAAGRAAPFLVAKLPRDQDFVAKKAQTALGERASLGFALIVSARLDTTF